MARPDAGRGVLIGSGEALPQVEVRAAELLLQAAWRRLVEATE